MAQQQDDESMLLEARTDRSAFAAFYRRHASAVYRWFALHVTRDPDALDDLTAETFAQALLSLGRFRSRGEGSAAAWLFAIARNQGRQFHRRRSVGERARRRLGMPLASTGAYDETEERLLAEQLGPSLRVALASLPAAQRCALELRVVHDLDYAGIGVQLGCSEENARVRVFRALRQLNTALALSSQEAP